MSLARAQKFGIRTGHLNPKFPLLIAAIALAISAQTAFAGGKHTPPPSSDPDQVATSSAGAGSESSAGALAGAGALSGSSSGAHAGQGQTSENDNRSSSHAAGGRALSGSSSNSGSDVYVDQGDELNTYRSTSRALALSLPGLVAAPAVPGECREHKAGWGFFSAGKTGGTKLEQTCMDRQHCLNMADRLAAWGLIDVAARQLQQCGAVQADVSMKDRPNHAVPPPPAPVDMSDYVKREELIERDRRILEHTTSK